MTGTASEQRGTADERPFTSDLAVVYLARFAEGAKPVASFVESYLRHPAGVAHDCVVIRKGFPGGTTALDGLLAPLRARAVSVSDDGFDITAYAEVAAGLPHRQVVFLNTFSEIVCDDWLHKLHAACADPAVGIAGASGSYESLSSSMKRYNRAVWQFESRLSATPSRLTQLFRFVRKLLPRRLGNILTTKIVSYFVTKGTPPGLDGAADENFEAWWDREMAPGRRFEHLRLIPVFPNAHIRTNAFIIGRQLFLDCLPGRMIDKMDAYLFESGPDSLTQQTVRRGQKVIVVGADGQRFDMDLWPQSGTFRLGKQQNLLVKDNQTVAFDAMSESERRTFSDMTWGAHAPGSR